RGSRARAADVNRACHIGPLATGSSPESRSGAKGVLMALVAADVACMMNAPALVLLMTPALGFFYGGLVRSKNALNTMMMSVCSLGFAGVAWALLGYSLAFAPGNGALGGLRHAFLRGVDLEALGSIPHVLFF